MSSLLCMLSQTGHCLHTGTLRTASAEIGRVKQGFLGCCLAIDIVFVIVPYYMDITVLFCGRDGP